MKVEPEWVPAIALPQPAGDGHRAIRFATALTLAVVVWLLVWYGESVQTLVSTWRDNQTFAHGFLIAPISAWLIWRRREVLSTLDVRPNYAVLPLLAVAGLWWLLGSLTGVVIVQEYGLVLMIPLLAWTILGTRMVRVLAFPLAFLLLAVPFGEILLPPLMDYTATFTVLALRVTGIPVYREGLLFTIPSGSWSVVEACSGLRYLIACVTGGLLYAYLRYRGMTRRVVFVAISVAVPIVANWLRAYFIVMLDHLSGSKLAMDVDHLLYGWVFFGIVTLALFWAGSYWREDEVTQPQVPTVPVVHRQASSMSAIGTAAMAAAAVVTVWPVAAARIDLSTVSTAPVLRTPARVGTWRPLPGRLVAWTPHFAQPSAQVDQLYAAGNQRVGLYVGYYGDQKKGSELITSRNTLVPSIGGAWRNAGETHRTLTASGNDYSLIETQLTGPETSLLVWRWYWVDGIYTANSYWAKLLQARSALLGRTDDGAVVIVYTAMEDGRDAAAMRLNEFVHAMLPALTQSLDDAR